MKRIILILFLLAMPAHAQIEYLAGIDEAIDIAMRNSSELRAAQARFGVTEAQVFTANTRLNPVFITENALADKNYHVGVQIIVETAGKRKKRTQAAQIQHEIVKDQIDTKILDIKANVRRAYIELYAAQKKKQLAVEMISLIDSLRQKKMPQSAETRLEMTRLNAQIELYNAQSQINTAHSSLNEFLGHELHKDGVLGTPELEHNFSDIAALSEEQHNLNIENLAKIAFENRPELRLQKNSIELAKKQLEIAEANRIPNLLLASGPDLSHVLGPLEVSAFIMGAMEIPIFDRQQGPIREAKAAREHAEKQYEYETENILSDIKDAYNRIVYNTGLIEKYKNEILPQSHKLVNSAIESYEKGNQSITLPLETEESAIKIEYAYIKALSDYQTAISDLERAIGRSL